MSEIENLIAEIERSVLYDDKPKTWNFDSISYVARLIAHIKDLQKEIIEQDKMIDTPTCTSCDMYLNREHRYCVRCHGYFCVSASCPEKRVHQTDHICDKCYNCTETDMKTGVVTYLYQSK